MTIDYPRESEIPALKALWKEAFGDSDAEIGLFFRCGFSLRRCRCARVAGRIAGMAYWFRCSCRGKPVAYLYAVATAEAMRGRGICRALLEDIREILRQQGYSGVILVPEPHLFPMYEKLGYRVSTEIREELVPAGKTVALTQVTAGEFADLRCRWLPAGGVAQTGENLDYLGGYARFYAGADFLLAEEKGRILEFLGNEQAAGGALGALGLENAWVRRPGPGRPFAMYHPLDKEPAPDYFGLAFD